MFRFYLSIAHGRQLSGHMDKGLGPVHQQLGYQNCVPVVLRQYVPQGRGLKAPLESGAINGAKYSSTPPKMLEWR